MWSSGLSPQVRGNLGYVVEGIAVVGSIPASAGEPEIGGGADSGAEVYPRKCGGTAFAGAERPFMTGLSPQVRGNPSEEEQRAGDDGSIPASAGEPRGRRRGRRRGRVYPRKCGGTRLTVEFVVFIQGLSPQVRGNPTRDQSSSALGGSIPASAGEPRAARPRWTRHGVYPRKCGGTFSGMAGGTSTSGLSPQVRGNPSVHRVACACVRSIPASAGEPDERRARRRRTWVYPRKCGGTLDQEGADEVSMGLSPQVRGNRNQCLLRAERAGSIPASAGEPSEPPISKLQWGVYPRKCGGTVISLPTGGGKTGLSPQVRGNHANLTQLRDYFGSIPASAGEPWSAKTHAKRWRVYPRKCGGTRLVVVDECHTQGLSPQVRGNQPCFAQQWVVVGSIPASAGEPGTSSAPRPPIRVYPRKCGGTSDYARHDWLAAGLSPQVRGNPAAARPMQGGSGSIPASAGEPLADARRQWRYRVYPRKCGGTIYECSPRQTRRGLSPQVRGNLSSLACAISEIGSIPASAGEPRSPARSGPS